MMSLAINILARTLSQLAELALDARVFSENMASRIKSVTELLVEHCHLAQAYEEEGEETPRSRSTSSKVRALEAAHGTLGLALKYFRDAASTTIFDYETRLQEMCGAYTMAIKTLKGMHPLAFRALFPSTCYALSHMRRRRRRRRRSSNPFVLSLSPMRRRRSSNLVSGLPPSSRRRRTDWQCATQSRG